ncbi:MAG: hypothetical protein AAFP90_03865, partial [Planctomycetota bacterium]
MHFLSYFHQSEFLANRFAAVMLGLALAVCPLATAFAQAPATQQATELGTDDSAGSESVDSDAADNDTADNDTADNDTADNKEAEYLSAIQVMPKSAVAVLHA